MDDGEKCSPQSFLISRRYRIIRRRRLYAYIFMPALMTGDLSPTVSVQAAALVSPQLLLAEDRCVRSSVVCLNHVDCECIVCAWVSKTVCDVGLCLAVATDVLNIQVQKIIVLFQ